MKIHTEPYSWDSLDRNILQECSDLIEKRSQYEITSAIVNDFKNNFSAGNLTPKSITISKHPILNVRKATIIASFKKFPSNDDDFNLIRGMARLIKLEEGILPVVYMFPNAGDKTLVHECIHLCQWLNPDTYQLNFSERLSLFQHNKVTAINQVAKTNKDQVLDYIIRLVCYTVWMELEAYYFSYRKTEKDNYKVLQSTQRSSQPFVTFEQSLLELDIIKHNPDAVAVCTKRFTDFCNELEQQVSWVSKLASAIKANSLYEALSFCKMDDDVDKVLGPIENF